MPVTYLNGHRITDWDAFHTECHAVLGFPDFYGRNMDAWIDCMSGLRDDDGMSSFVLGPDEMLDIEVLHTDTLKQSAPEILSALKECIDEVNERCAEFGEKPTLRLILR